MRRPRMAGAAASSDDLLATYPDAEARGVKPAAVGTVDVATEVVVDVVVVASSKKICVVVSW